MRVRRATSGRSSQALERRIALLERSLAKFIAVGVDMRVDPAAVFDVADRLGLRDLVERELAQKRRSP